MSKEMNKLLRYTVKNDLLVGILISLLIVLSSCFLNAVIYFLGISIGLLNFICSYYVTDKFLFKEGPGGAIALFITIFRIMIVVIIAVPLVNNLEFIILYMSGFISHLIILSISCILKNR